MSAPSGLEVLPLAGIQEIPPQAELGALSADAAERSGHRLLDGDVVVISQKAVSKAEGRIRDLAEVTPSGQATELAGGTEADPRLIQLALDESRSVIRAERGVLIVETRSGWICANAGIDASNVPGETLVTLLPEDPDRSARRIRQEIAAAAGVRPAVIIADSFGRPWRLGQADVAIGCAGLRPLDDWRGRRDRDGSVLSATEMAIADEVAAAAELVRPKDGGIPACVVRGLDRHVIAEDGPGAAVIRRPEAEDLFR